MLEGNDGLERTFFSLFTLGGYADLERNYFR